MNKTKEIVEKQIEKWYENATDTQETDSNENVLLEFGTQVAKAQELATLREVLKLLENPYPKDIFCWDNKEKLNFNRGRFNRHCYEIVENIRTDIEAKIKELKKCP